MWGSIVVLCFVVHYFVSILVMQSSWWWCKSWFLWLVCLHVSRDCCAAFLRSATSLSAVCDCGICWSYSLPILNVRRMRLISHGTHIKHVFSPLHLISFFKDITCLFILTCTVVGGWVERDVIAFFDKWTLSIAMSIAVNGHHRFAYSVPIVILSLKLVVVGLAQ